MSTSPSDFHICAVPLNTPPFIDKTVTVAISIRSQKSVTITNLQITDYIDKYSLKGNYAYAADSAVTFNGGEKQALIAKADKNKITFGGIHIPPKEIALVFYKLHKLTD